MAIDYTRRDFNTIKEDLLRRASSVLPEWTDRDPSDFGMVFVDLWSYMGDVLHYYIDRASKEAFINTATQRESVLALANLLDYRPKGRTRASSTVVLSNSSGTTAYTLPAGTVLTGQSDTGSFTCYTLSDVELNVNGEVPTTVYEGSIVLENEPDGNLGVSSGTASQRFDIPATNVVEGSIRVFVKEDGVNNTQYRFVPRISDARFGERVFSTYTTAQGTTQILFGSNINGFIPPVNSPVIATYAVSSGKDGNYPANTVRGFQTFISSDVTVSSSTAFIGGSNEESIESLRTSIPISARPQNRAVTLDDFIDLALGVSEVYKATAVYSAASVPGAAASVTVYPVTLQTDYTTTSNTSASVGTELVTDIVNEIQPKTLLGVQVAVVGSVTLTPINITAKVYINERFVRSWVVTDIYAALENIFTFDNVNFGQRITLSQIYRTIVSIEGVDYAEIDPNDGGVFSTTSSGVEQSITVSSTALPRKGLITIDAYGGITTGG
jgi:uncharacterized phage protein gp47/JayE